MVFRASSLILATSLLACTEPESSSFTCAATPDKPANLVAAGSGVNVPLFRELARIYHSGTGAKVSVPESIGTAGAVKALEDGAIDIGLSSKPLTGPRKATAGIVEIPFATTPLVVAVRRDTAVGELDRETVRRVFSGELRKWPDGSSIVPLQREKGDSGWKLISEADPRLYDAILAGGELAYQKVCYTDTEVYEALQLIRGAIGFVDEGSARILGAPLDFEAVGGVTRTLYVLARKTRSEEVSRFLDFLETSEVTGYLERHGYEPLLGRGGSPSAD